MVQVTARTPCFATEVPERVGAALAAFFPGEVHADEHGFQLSGTDVTAFRQLVWELRIIDTVRSALLSGAEGNTLRFRLSKQAAAGGKVALPVSRHALGDVDVKFQVDESDPWDDAEALAWWLCPETADGEIVGPT